MHVIFCSYTALNCTFTHVKPLCIKSLGNISKNYSGIIIDLTAQFRAVLFNGICFRPSHLVMPNHWLVTQVKKR